MRRCGRHLASLRHSQLFAAGQHAPAATLIPWMSKKEKLATDAQGDGSAPSTSGRSWEQARAGLDQTPLYAANPLLENRLLLRDFIQNSLYHPTKGYFNRPQSVVGHLQTPIDHWKLYCAEEWRMLINKKYQELENSFLTPAELFSPWYGYILARHMLEHREHTLGLEGFPLRIIEVGGGNGTLARDMLDWIRDNRPDVYPDTTYTCLEISSKLAAQQYDTVVVKGGHGGRFHLSPGNAWHLSTWGDGPVWDHTYVLMMEVLDNLPHDRVYRRSEKHPWHQTYVVALPDKAAQQGGPPERLFSPPHTSAMDVSPSRAFKSRSRQGCSMETGPWREELGPMEDPLIKRALASSYVPTTFEERLDKRLNRLLDFLLARESEPDVAEGELFFVPTAALALLDVLHRARPNHSLIATDFDRLPGVRIPGRNAPLVAEKVKGKNIDHSTVLVPWGSSDIFFPTDFDALARMYKASAEEAWGAGTGIISTSHYVQGEVMKRYREMERTATICSFNPMIDDFRNARFFFGDSVGCTAAEADAQFDQEGKGQAQAEAQTRAAPSSAGTQRVLSGRGRRRVNGGREAVVDWDGASGDRRAPWSGSSQKQSKGGGPAPSAVPRNLPEWAQKRLLEQQQQQQQQQHDHQRSQRAPNKSPDKGSKQ